MKEVIRMQAEATSKLEEEIKKNENNPYVKLIGEHLIKHLESNPSDAEKVLDNEKTILKSLEAMRKVAEKKKVGNMAILTDEEGYAEVYKYFGINSSKPVAVQSTSSALDPESDFDINLDDLLGGL